MFSNTIVMEGHVSPTRDHPTHIEHDSTISASFARHGLTGAPLVAAITSVCSSGFLLFGYDRGVMSGDVIFHYRLDAMGHPSTIMLSTITALYDVGAVFGAIASCSQ